METIAENEKYEIKVEASKKRIYFKVIGYWKRVEEVPNFISDVQKAVNIVGPGFSIITDMRSASPPAEEARQLHVKTSEIMKNNNVNKIAEIVDSSVVKLSVSRTTSADLKRQSFSSVEEAESWLDE